MANKKEEYTYEDKRKYQDIFKRATASPAEQREEKSIERRKSFLETGRFKKRGEVTGKKIKGEMDKDLARVQALRKKQEAEEKAFKQKQKESKAQRYQQPRPIFGRPKDEFTIKGGAGPRGKQLKRI